MLGVVPRVIEIYGTAGIVVPYAEHCVPFEVDEHRAAGIYLCLVVGKGKAVGDTGIRVLVVRVYELVVLRSNGIAP